MRRRDPRPPHRCGGVPGRLRYLAAALFVPAGAVGVLALSDEGPVAAVLLLVAVLVPLGLEAGLAVRAGRPWTDAPALATMAWSGPYVLGAFAFFAVTVDTAELLDVPPARSRAVGVPWVAVAVAGRLAPVVANG